MRTQPPRRTRPLLTRKATCFAAVPEPTPTDLRLKCRDPRRIIGSVARGRRERLPCGERAVRSLRLMRQATEHAVILLHRPVAGCFRLFKTGVANSSRLARRLGRSFRTYFSGRFLATCAFHFRVKLAVSASGVKPAKGGISAADSEKRRPAACNLIYTSA